MDAVAPPELANQKQFEFANQKGMISDAVAAELRSSRRYAFRVSGITRGSRVADVKTRASAAGSRSDGDFGRAHMLHHIRPDAFADRPEGTNPVKVCHQDSEKESESIP
jgi:hypothetical protein